MATSYFRERARNPYLRSRSVGLEDEPMSPTFGQLPPLDTPTAPRAVAPTVAPPVTTPTSPDPIELARSAYEAKVPQGFGGRLKDALLTAGLGFLQGAARDPNNPLAAGLGGAVTGGAISAINPRLGRGLQFETVERPRIEDRMRREEERRKKQQAEEDRARAISMDALKHRGMEAEIADVEAQTKARGIVPLQPGASLIGTDGRVIYQGQPQPSKEAFPFSSSSLGIYNKQTGEVTTPAPPAPSKAPSQAESALNELAEMKQSVQELWRQWKLLPAGSQEREKARLAADDALQAYNQAVAGFGELYGDWFETGQGTGGWHYAKRRQGQPQGAKPQGTPQSQSPRTGISRPRSQFNSKLFPGLKFE